MLLCGGPAAYPLALWALCAPLLSRIAVATRDWRVPFCGLTGLVSSSGNALPRAGVVKGTFLVHPGPRVPPLLGPGGTWELLIA